jgi:hypothetical protein
MSEWLPGCYIESDSIPNNPITISIISKVLISINNHIQSTYLHQHIAFIAIVLFCSNINHRLVWLVTFVIFILTPLFVKILIFHMLSLLKVTCNKNFL